MGHKCRKLLWHLWLTAEAEAEDQAEAEGPHHTYNCTVFAAVAAVCILSF